MNRGRGRDSEVETVSQRSYVRYMLRWCRERHVSVAYFFPWCRHVSSTGSTRSPSRKNGVARAILLSFVDAADVRKRIEEGQKAHLSPNAHLRYDVRRSRGGPAYA